ncbi:MAG TPA: hypothetical protein VD833_09780 [Vicinamibacterales bacterium]|nr:hypothetical protein [Vicinamibacterales bacterium]
MRIHPSLLSVAVLGLLFSSACLRSTTTISVKADGSGTVLQETGVSPQTLAMLKGMGGQGGPPADLIGEEQAKKAAAMMGVQFVSGEPFKTAELEGYRARYAFADIRNVKMRMNQAEAAGMPGTKTSDEPPFSFGFDQKGASSLLTITVPEQKTGPVGALPQPPPGSDPQENEQALQMMKAMMRGLYVDVSLAVDGKILKTNAPHVSGSTVTLLQVDFDKLLADPNAFKKLQGATDLKGLATIPGLKVIADRTLTVEFAR